MKLKFPFLLLLMLACFAFAEETARPAVAAAAATMGNPSVAASPATEAVPLKDGYALLDGLLILWDNLYPEPKSKDEKDLKAAQYGFQLVDERISNLFKEAKASREANLIDNIFFNRYRRVLMMYKLIVIPVFKHEVLEPLFRQAFVDFVHDVTFETWVWGEKDAIPKLGAAVREEFVQLHFYLEDRQKSEEFKQKVGLRVLPPPPAPPDKPKSK